MSRIVIIGGGVAGMTSAIFAARKGAEVTILESNDILGKKILSTGNGRCNIGNLDISVDHYYSDHNELITSLLTKYSTNDLLDFLEEIDIDIRTRESYIYPKCSQATSVRDAFELECRHLGVVIHCNTHVDRITGTGPFHIICNDNTVTYKADRVILTCGSKASTISGSDGSGYSLAKSYGHTIIPVVPALVQLHAEGMNWKKVSGVRTDATVTIFVDGVAQKSDTGELQLTNYGISGIPVFQISRIATKALSQKKLVEASIDFLPGISLEDLKAKLRKRIDRYGKRTAQDLINTLIPEKLISMLLLQTGIEKMKWAEKVDSHTWDSFCTLVKDYRVRITDSNGFKQAQICAGGISTLEVNSATMESRKQPGMFIAGELLDVDGICGGYNIEFAILTGMVSGLNASKER